ncbi:phage tail protein [Actinomadura spongiicola]|uniref:Phage tail protein n=1 Tax=Actinomadura spongiicola TaxID=2303421 RepID=A0A372GC90_9ACTN|nr:phage tail protein [Actinomadura spongiicola]RFS82739.1 phage tail protein [Actinomadura spongiicola]
MAGINATEIRVAGTGRVLVAPKNTDMAAPGTTLGAEWKDLGYTTNDGIKFTKKDKLDPVDSWQSMAAVRFVQSDRDLTVKFQLIQINVDTLPFVMGSGNTPLTPDVDGVMRYDISATPVPAEFALGLEFTDGASVTRFYVPRGVVTDMDEVQFAKNAPVKLGVTINAVASDATPVKPLASWMTK